jgi:predicted amidophosphoribosyltransferase
VPLHPRRLVSRGYNQSALLAAHVASELSKPLLPSALARKVDTLPQVDQSAHGRQTNVAAAFAVASPASIKGRMLGLIDDVVTTGATLGACREALLAAGARGVVRVVLARAPSSALRIPLGLDAAPLQNVGLDGARAS